MAVFRWGGSWDVFGDLGHEVDRLLETVNLTFQSVRMGRQYPAVNLYELQDEYLLTAELPGMSAGDVELSLAAGILTMKGTRTGPEGVPEERFRRHERFRGFWQRSFTIPERVDEENLRAEMRDGILTVHLPKAQELRPRRIPVVGGPK